MDVHDVVDVHAELQPHPLVREDARREQPLAIGVQGLVEEHPRRTVQLADDCAFGPVDNKRAFTGHQG